MKRKEGDKMDNLKALREEKGISQQKLAEQIGTIQQNIHRYENKFYEPDIRTLKLIANFFNTSVDYLVGNSTIRHKIESVEKFDLNQEESDLMDKYRQLSIEARKSITNMIDVLLDSAK